MLKLKAAVVVFSLPLTSCFALQTSVAIQPSAVAQSHVVKMVTLVANVDKSIDTKRARAGDPFAAKVANPEKLDDGTSVPAGSILEGRIDSVTPSENKGDSILTVTINKLAIKNGREIPVKATIIHVASLAPDISGDKGYPDPSNDHANYIPSTQPTPFQDPRAPKGPHAIHDLTMSSSPKDSTSGTFVQAKRNLHLANTVQLQISVAPVAQISDQSRIR